MVTRVDRTARPRNDLRVKLGCAAEGFRAAPCLDPELALAYAVDQLGGVDRDEVERRIDHCPRCRSILAEAARELSPPRDATTTSSVATIDERPHYLRSTAPDDSLDATDPVAPGDRVGRYLVQRTIGRGGMGVVSLARDPDLDRLVVIKLVRPDLASGERDDHLEARLRREAQAMAKLSHPNVVRIFDIGRHGDRVFLALEYIAAPTLDVWLGNQPRTTSEILALAVQAGNGLAAAHRAGLIHRDFKPSNVMIDPEGVAKVTDFGLARRTRAAPETALVPVISSTTEALLTDVATVIGTPAYMAPEQLAGAALDARADQYAFAVTLLDALVGQSPTARRIEATAPRETLEQALTARAVAPEISAALARALAPVPMDRFATLGELVAIFAPRAKVRSRMWWFAVPVFACAAVLAATLGLQSDDRCIVEAPGHWGVATRAHVVAALSARDTLFAAWTADRVARAIDSATKALGEDQAAGCKGGTTAATRCTVQRQLALDRAVTAILRDPTCDPWPMIAAVEHCSLATTRSLREELRTDLSRPAAHALADRATAEGNHLVAAEALEVAGLASFAAGELDDATRDLRAMEAAGERAGDDAMRARSLVHLLDIARWQGDLDAITREVEALQAILNRHGDPPREQLIVCEAETRALIDIGDRVGVEAATQRCFAAALRMNSPDATLQVRTAHAWARYALQLDLEAARRETDSALADAASVSPAARAGVLAMLGEVALLQHDGPAATAAFATATQLASERVRDPVARIQAARALALTGHVEAALADLIAIPTTTPITAMRVDIARALLLRDAHREPEAYALLETIVHRLAPWPYAKPMPPAPPAMPLSERVDAAIAFCEVERVVGKTSMCTEAERLTHSLHPLAAVRARALLAGAREQKLAVFAGWQFERAITIAIADKAPPLLIAQIQWERARLGEGSLEKRRQFALAARDTFATSLHATEVAAINAWLRGEPTPAPVVP